MSVRFYVNCPLAPGSLTLQGPEAHHLAVVSRLRPGDPLCLFNGDGREFPATVVDTSRRHVIVQVSSPASPDRELAFRLEVAAPLPRGDRGQFLLEKLTELGVTSFVPLRTQRSMLHPGDSRRDRLQRHVIEASKQCGRNVLLTVQPPADWAAYCTQGDLPTLRVLAHPSGEPYRGPTGVDQAIAVGPEGGFTVEEVALAHRHGWRVAGLGPRILRVETAAVALACCAALGSALTAGAGS